jgi:M6 family metalloprotease-like protein
VPQCRILPAPTLRELLIVLNWWLSLSPSQKAEEVIVVLIKFSDYANRDMPSRQNIEYLFNGQGTGDKRAPTGTVREFFRLQSLNQYAVEAHVQEWMTVDQTEEYYSFGNNGLTNMFATAAYKTLDRMDREGVDWFDYDEDGDGKLDSVAILHSGFVAEGGGTDCINGREYGKHRIWSHATSAAENQDVWYSSDRIVSNGQYSTTSAVFGTCGSDIQRVAVIGHEMMHMLGLPDLLRSEGRAVGIFDVMGTWRSVRFIVLLATQLTLHIHFVSQV